MSKSKSECCPWFLTSSILFISYQPYFIIPSGCWWNFLNSTTSWKLKFALTSEFCFVVSMRLKERETNCCFADVHLSYYSGNLGMWLRSEGKTWRKETFFNCMLLFCSKASHPFAFDFSSGQESLTSLVPTRRLWTWRNPTTAACQPSLNTWWVIL